MQQPNLRNWTNTRRACILDRDLVREGPGHDSSGDGCRSSGQVVRDGRCAEGDHRPGAPVGVCAVDPGRPGRSAGESNGARCGRSIARRLENRRNRSQEPWSDFVNDCESILATENTSWIAKWTKMNQDEPGGEIARVASEFLDRNA